MRAKPLVDVDWDSNRRMMVVEDKPLDIDAAGAGQHQYRLACDVIDGQRREELARYRDSLLDEQASDDFALVRPAEQCLGLPNRVVGGVNVLHEPRLLASACGDLGLQDGGKPDPEDAFGDFARCRGDEAARHDCASLTETCLRFKLMQPHASLAVLAVPTL